MIPQGSLSPPGRGRRRYVASVDRQRPSWTDSMGHLLECASMDNDFLATVWTTKLSPQLRPISSECHHNDLFSGQCRPTDDGNPWWKLMTREQTIRTFRYGDIRAISGTYMRDGPLSAAWLPRWPLFGRRDPALWKCFFTYTIKSTI